jgi:hypothetical protein
MDLFPSFATCVDFGIDDPKTATQVFGALQWAYKHEVVCVEELDAAMCNGPQLTEIINRKSWGRTNPYSHNLVITTAYDNMGEEA